MKLKGIQDDTARMIIYPKCGKALMFVSGNSNQYYKKVSLSALTDSDTF